MPLEIALTLAGAALGLAVWVVIPLFLRLRYRLPEGGGVLMELMLLTLWLARVLRLPRAMGGDGDDME